MRLTPPPTALAAVLVSSMMTAAPATAQDESLLERGRYLMESVVACGNCHGARGDKGQLLPERGLSGGTPFNEPPFDAYASNITPDPDTGVGRWTDAQLALAIREGRRPDGSLIGPPMPVAFYRQMSDRDLAAVVAYLRAQPPVRNVVPKSVYRMPLPPSYGPPVVGVAEPPRIDRVKYGEYLATIGHCMQCHTPNDDPGRPPSRRLGAGGLAIKGPWGISVSRNLTPHASGLKDWTDAQIVRAVRDGVDRDGRPYKPPMAFEFYRRIRDDDMAALVAYLRSLPPQDSGR